MGGESRIAIQMRVLFALIMREMSTRFGRSAGGYVWAVLEPAAHIAMLSVIFSQIARTPPLGESFPFFFATGYMAFHLYADVAAQVSNSLAVNRPLLSFPRINLLDAILARFALQMLTGVFVTVLILSGVYLASPDRLTVHLAPIFHAIALAALMAFGVGTLNCVLFAYSKTWERFFKVVNRPLFLISGVFFIYEDLPHQIQALLWWNPLVHVVTIMRTGFYPTYEPTFVTPMFPMLTGMIALMLGIMLLRVLRARVLDP